MRTLTFAHAHAHYSVSTQFVTPPFSHKYWSGQNWTGCAGPATQNSFDPSSHLSWGDVAVNDRSSPTTIKVHLKQSKCDQLGKGIDVFVGHTHDPLCPVTSTVRYMALRGATPAPFFISKNGISLTKSHFVSSVREALMAIGLPYQLSAGHSYSSSQSMPRRFDYLFSRLMEQCCISNLHSVRRITPILPHPGALMIITIVYYQHSWCTNSIGLWGDGTPFFPWTGRPLIWLYKSPKDKR